MASYLITASHYCIFIVYLMEASRKDSESVGGQTHVCILYCLIVVHRLFEYVRRQDSTVCAGIQFQRKPFCRARV